MGLHQRLPYAAQATSLQLSISHFAGKWMDSMRVLQRRKHTNLERRTGGLNCTIPVAQY